MCKGSATATYRKTETRALALRPRAGLFARSWSKDLKKCSTELKSSAAHPPTMPAK